MRINESTIRRIIKEEAHRALLENVADNNDDEVIRDFATLLALHYREEVFEPKKRHDPLANLNMIKGSQDAIAARGAARMIKLLDAVDEARGKIKGERFSILDFFRPLFSELRAAYRYDVVEALSSSDCGMLWRGYSGTPHFGEALFAASTLHVYVSRPPYDPRMLRFAREFEKAMRDLEAHSEELTKVMQLREATPKLVRFFKDPSTKDYREKIIELLCGDLDSVLQAAELAEALIM